MTDKQSNRKFWIGAIVGGVVGGVTALLFAPKSGRELRQDIADGAKQATEKTQQIAQQIGDKTSDWVEAAREKKDGLKRSFHEWRHGSAEESLTEQIANVSSQDSGKDIESPLCEEEKDANFVI